MAKRRGDAGEDKIDFIFILIFDKIFICEIII
jgi:hypothetical protein